MTDAWAEYIAEASERAVAAFVEEFERAPNKREIDMIVSAIMRHIYAADAPTTRLQ